MTTPGLVDLDDPKVLREQLDYPTLVGGTNWRLVGVTKFTDGDTLRILRDRYVDSVAPEVVMSDRFLAQVTLSTYVRDDPGPDPTDPMAGRAARLVYVDTPELENPPSGPLAAQQTKAWVEARAGQLMVTTWGTKGGFDRLLADIWVAGDRNNTLSRYLLIEAGWPPYVEGK